MIKVKDQQQQSHSSCTIIIAKNILDLPQQTLYYVFTYTVCAIPDSSHQSHANKHACGRVCNVKV